MGLSIGGIALATFFDDSKLEMIKYALFFQAL